MRLLAIMLGLATSVISGSAFATATPGEDWQYNFFEAVTPIMEQIHSFHEGVLLPIIVAITLFVLALLIYVAIRFRRGANPVASKTTHHVGIEIIWTIVPVLILMIIAIPSVRLLFAQDETPKSDITIKAIGYQWYWGYEYPEQKVAEYSAYMRCLPDNGKFDQSCLDKLKEEKVPHKLATDYPVVVPVDKNIRVLVTAMDVIHSWAMPAFGVKKDAIPGRLNQTWFRANKVGTYYGQCSELCGVNHAFMPITVEVVPQDVYDAWLVEAQVGNLDNGNKIINDYKVGNFTAKKIDVIDSNTESENDDASNQDVTPQEGNV